MENTALLIVASIVFFYGILSRYLERLAITAPMVFLVVGWIIGMEGLERVDVTFEEPGVRLLAEATLVVVLFADATRIDLMVLRRQFDMPGRLLGLGMPLTIISGGLLAAWIIPDVSLAEGFLIGAILAPTDAALGKAVITNRLVPVRVRQVLNVESGLNDGIALPLVTALVAVAAATQDLETPAYWVRFAIREIAVGSAVGLLVGVLGGFIMRRAWDRKWVTGAARQLVTLAVAVMAFAASDALAGNGFIAAFVAGAGFGGATRDMHTTAADLTEDIGELATWMTFLFFGVVIVGEAVAALTWQKAIYALLSLTVVRMVPVAFALVGTHCDRATAAFLGWFGPRGLASILFALLFVEKAGGDVADRVRDVVAVVVIASVFVHGITAKPGADRYVARATRLPSDMPELQPVNEMPEPRRGGLFNRRRDER